MTRQKRNATCRVIERHEVVKSKGLTCDQTILITGTKAKVCSIPLRRIGYRDPETGKHYVFLTNNFRLVAMTIAVIYKARWQIELQVHQEEPEDTILRRHLQKCCADAVLDRHVYLPAVGLD